MKDAALATINATAKPKPSQVVDIGGVPHLWSPDGQGGPGVLEVMNVGQGGKAITPKLVGDTAGSVAQGEAAGRKAGEEGGNYFNLWRSAKGKIKLYDDAIRAIDKGANVGAIENRAPSFKAATLELIQVGNSLGLDVLNSATFGSLSEQELKLALQTGLPTDMQEEDLRDWLVRKREATDKLVQEYRRAAEFLLGGGTLVDFLKQQDMSGMGGGSREEVLQKYGIGN